MKIDLKIISLFTFLAFYNCAELNSVLSNYNQSNGGQCATILVMYSLLNSETGKYESGLVYTKDKDGNDIAYKEESWRNNLGNSYLNRGEFTAYYNTSPYSGGEYKFVVYCSSWY
tara:strand:+ start:118 stop:462 length:345 start_codon:yes stop_codon:yes gene_type:complete